MAYEQQLADGRIERRNPRTGQTRIISREDAVRTALTRERDAEFSMQAGAPPIAKGPPSMLDRVDADMAKAGNRAPGRARLELPHASSFADTFTKKDPISAGTVGQAAQIGTPGPTAATPAQGGLVATSPAAPATTVTPTTPAAPSRPVPVLPPVGIAVAAGPNISTAPTGLPPGSIGYQRADGTYTVETAPGQSQSFANEAAARNPPPQAKPNAEVSASTAPAGQPGTPAATEAAKQQDGATPQASPGADSQLAPAYTIKGVGQRVGQAAANLATDQTAANPLNLFETVERYGAAGLGAAWDGTWQVPEKGLIRRGVEAVAERDPLIQNIGSAIGDAQAQARKREAVAAGRLDPNFDARAEAARQRYSPDGATPVSYVGPAPVAPAPVGVAPRPLPVMPDPAGVDMARPGGVGRSPIMPALPPLPESTPVSYVGPAPRIDMTPRPVPTPTNGSRTSVREMPSLTNTLRAVATAPARMLEAGRTEQKTRERKAQGDAIRKRVAPALMPDLDAGSVADPEPFGFPGLRQFALPSRPTARLA